MTCCHCEATDQEFDARTARRDLKRFERRGPDVTTRHILTLVRELSLPPAAALLDVGGGIGTIHHTLLEQGFARALQVDASSAYLEVAAAEARKRGHAGRVEFRRADFPAVASSLPMADVVTLDRVVCCDPDCARLLGAAAGRARRALAFSYPRVRWFVRLVIGLFNVSNRLRGRAFQAHLHSPAKMAGILERAGLRRRKSAQAFFWAVEIYERPAPQ
jgi:magnesium-protoporphyrin O-methyltransferase